jgi:8-oxo-dGTP diphosphatase
MDEPPIEGAAVLIVDETGRILLQQRDDDVPPAGYGRWALPGGRIEPGETPRQAAFREIAEETGLLLRDVRPFDVFEQAPSAAGRPGRRIHVFCSGDEVDEAAIEVNEGLAFRFHDAAAIAELRMNALPRAILARFLGSGVYRDLLAGGRGAGGEAAVIALDRWGRVLLVREGGASGAWSLPAGRLAADEPPDAAALRIFEEATGRLLEDLRLFRVERRDRGAAWHVYYDDPDIALDGSEGRESHEYRYVRPEDTAGAGLAEDVRPLLAAFFASGAYRALFH